MLPAGRVRRWLGRLLGWAVMASVGCGWPGPPAEAQAEAVGAVEARLDNGLRLVFQYNPASPVVAICAFVHTSAAQETWNSAGVRELLQLMGERTRVRPGQLREAVPPVVELRTTLSRDYVEMVALCLPEEVSPALQRLRGALFDPYFSGKSFRFAQERLYQQVRARQSVALTTVQDVLVGRLYPEWPGSWPLVGTGAATWVNLDYVQQYHTEHYLTNRTLLAVTGQIEWEELQQQVEEVFGNLLPGERRRLLPPPVGAPPQAGQMQLELPQMEVSVVAAGGRAPALVSEDYPAAAVLMALLGSGRGSRLYGRLREEQNLSYSIRAGITPSQVCPYAYVIATCQAAQVEAVREAIGEELQNLTAQVATPEELRRARRSLWGQYQLQQQDNQQLAHYLGLFALLGGEEGAQMRRSFPLHLAAVRPEQVQAQCRKIFAQPVVVTLRGGPGSPG